MIQPEGFPEAVGYANGIVSDGPKLFIAGQVGWDQSGSFPTGFVDQFAQALDNVKAVMDAAGAPSDGLLRMTVYVTDISAYRSSLKQIGEVWRERFGHHFPAMALVGVTGLVSPDALVEIETTVSMTV